MAISYCVVCRCALLIPLSRPSQKAGSLTDAEGLGGERGLFGRASSLTPSEEGGKITTKMQSCRSQRELSAVGGQLGLNVHSADGAFPAGSQPLIHARLMEEVHAR